MSIIAPHPSDDSPEVRSDHPAKLVRGEDEDYVEYLTRQGDAWSSNPPPAPPGFDLIECTATPRHWPTYTVTDTDFYDGPCPHCSYDALSKAHGGCAHSHHKAWRRWKLTGKIASWLYVTGITSSGGSWQVGGGCPGCHTMPKFNRNQRPYILGASRDTWRCWSKRHRVGDPIGFGFCAKCVPCPTCGSETAGHEPSCEDA